MTKYSNFIFNQQHFSKELSGEDDNNEYWSKLCQNLGWFSVFLVVSTCIVYIIINFNKY